MGRKLFSNLSVKDLEKSIAFFRGLGFAFEPKFTNESGACMVVNEGAYVMLLAETFFRTFTQQQICDTATHTEGIFAFSCGSRVEVDELADKALATGGRHAMPPQDHGFMYCRSFYDLDGHHWEVFWMNPEATGG